MAMENVAMASQPPPPLSSGKRKRGEADELSSADPTPSSKIPSASQLANNLKSTSPDVLRQTLTQIRQTTRVESDEELSSIGPNDKRLAFVRELLEDKGWMRLLEAWERIHDMGIPSLFPLPVYAVSQVIALMSCHFIDHEVCSNLIQVILPMYGGAGDAGATLWNKLHSYILNSQQQRGAQAKSAPRSKVGDETLIIASLQLLTHIVRFERGRFSRIIVENVAWNAKTISRFPGMNKKAGKNKKQAAIGPQAPTSKSTFARPDVRLAFTAFLLAILYPSHLTLSSSVNLEGSDSGAPTSVKMQLLSQDGALSHLTSILKTLPGDPTSVVTHVLAVLQRALLKDPKLPRTILVNLTRSSDFLSLLLQLGTRDDSQLRDMAFSILRALCTIPGRGICFQDQGWYGRSLTSSPPGVKDTVSGADDAIDAGPPSTSAVQQNEHASNVYNPILNSFIQSQSFSPLYVTSHRELLLAILSAAKELQPSFLNSMRGPFGGGRMEPPLSGTGSGAGARLGGLLANRLMGQVVDLDLPSFKSDRPPPIAKLVTSLVPNTIPRVNIVKGLKHSDRLVQWSTLGLLIRIVSRLDKFQREASRFAHNEDSWNSALETVTKECLKRLPDVSTVLQVIESTSASGSAAATSTATAKPDFLLLEATLRASCMLLQVSQGRNTAVAHTFDVRKLLNVAGLAEKQVASTVDESEESQALKPVIQLHVLRILRLSRLGAFFVSSATDSSIFAQLVLISQASSGMASQQVRQEANTLLLEVFGARSTSVAQHHVEAGQNQLLFEGDSEEPEAWLAALPASDKGLPHVIAFLEDCLSRCSKNSYRYLESARRTLTQLESSDSLPVSPLFATLKEQLLIKLEKGVFSSPEAQQAVLAYFARLTPLLAVRLRQRAGAVLQLTVDEVGQVLKSITDAEGGKIIETLRNVLALLDGHKSTETVTACMWNSQGVDKVDSTTRSSEDFLLLDPISNNVLLSRKVDHDNLPPYAVLLHSASLNSTSMKQDEINFADESPAFSKLSLHLVRLILASDDEKQVVLASRALEHLTTTHQVNKIDMQRYFFSSIGEQTIPHKAVFMTAAKVFDPLSEDDCIALHGSLDALRSFLDSPAFSREHADLILLFLPFFSQAMLEELQSSLASGLDTTDVQQCTWCLDILRNVAHLCGNSSAESLNALLRLPSLVEGNTSLLTTLVATLLDVLKSSTDLGNLDLTSLDLTWLSQDICGADELQACLITKVPSARAEFAARLSRSENDLHTFVSAFPRAVRAFVRCTNAGGEAIGALESMVKPLAERLFSDDVEESALSSDSLLLLVDLAEGSTNDLLQGLLQHVPQQPGKTFRLGAYVLGARLVSRGIASTATYAQRLIDQGLAWMVRRFAEDDSDDDALLDVLDVFTVLTHQAAEFSLAAPKAHLASPVLEAGLKRRFTERRQMEFLQVLTRHTDIGEASSSALFTSVLAHANFKAVAGSAGEVESIGREIVVSMLHSLASRYPNRLLTSQSCRSLIEVYGATLSLSDRLLFDLFKRFESVTQATFASLAKSWSGTGSLATSAPTSLDALLSLDAAKAFASCSAFPRERGYESLEAGLTFPHLDDADEVQRQERQRERELYDPLWILLLLSSVLNEEQVTGLQWLAIVRSNALGVVVCAMSSKIDLVREIASTILARTYTSLQACDLQEKDHLLMALDAIKNNVSSTAEEALPLTTTLFIAHHLRLITSPSSALYPIFSRFLLQRPTFDKTDVPMFYSMLQSSDPDNWKLQRTWMLRFLRDCLRARGSTLEWRVMKRRYVWELLCSMHRGLAQSIVGGQESGTAESTSTSVSSAIATSKQSLALIEEIMLTAVARPAIATELITRKGLLTWISQQVSMQGADTQHDEQDGEDADERRAFWLRMLRIAFASMQSTGVLDKMDASTASTWCLLTLEVVREILGASAAAAGGASLVKDTLQLLNLISAHFDVADSTVSVDRAMASELATTLLSSTSVMLAARHRSSQRHTATRIADGQAEGQDDECGHKLRERQQLQHLATIGSRVAQRTARLCDGDKARGDALDAVEAAFAGCTA